MPSPLDAEVLTISVSPPHSTGFKPLLRELAIDLVDVGRRVDVGQVDLVERHHDRHAGRLGVGDGLDGLGHHTVVGGDDQDDDVGDVGASGTHRGERLVARRIDERDRAAVGLDLVSADVLGDAAALGIDDVRLANPVQERRLAVVDVAQDRDDRGPRHEVLRRAGGREGVEQVVFGGALVNDLELDAELEREHGRHLVVERGVDRGELVHCHQLADQVVGLDSDRQGKAANGDRRFDLGVRLARRGDRDPLAASRLLDAGAGAARVFVVGQEGGGGDRRGDAAIDGPLASPGAAAGAIGGRAEPAGLAFLVVLFLGRHRGSGRRPAYLVREPDAARRHRTERGAARGGAGEGPAPRCGWPPRGPRRASRAAAGSLEMR